MKHIGILIPATNTVVENEVMKLCASSRNILDSLSFHFSRIEIDAEYACDENLFLDQLYNNRGKAYKMFKAIQMDALGFFCTSSELMSKNINALSYETIDNITCFNPLQSLIIASRLIKPTNILLFSPYSQNTALFLEKTFFENGLNVVKNIYLNLKVDIDKFEIEVAQEMIMNNLQSGVDLVVVSCTNFRTLELIEVIEKQTKIPVISSNQTLFWLICKQFDFDYGVITKYGKLFSY